LGFCTPLEADDDLQIIDTSSHRIRTLPQEQKQLSHLQIKYSSLIITKNKNENDWQCDICLSKESEDDDPLSMCELCMVVVHPTCYRRDLYCEDNKEGEPWFCQRCKYLI
jgi:hypothetical protein